MIQRDRILWHKTVMYRGDHILKSISKRKTSVTKPVADHIRAGLVPLPLAGIVGVHEETVAGCKKDAGGLVVVW